MKSAALLEPNVLVKLRLPEMDLCARAFERGSIGLEVTEFLFPGNPDPGWESRLSIYETLRKSIKGPVALHAPHVGLNNLCGDADIRRITRERCLCAIEIARRLGIHRIVFHSWYNPLVAGRDDTGWVAKSLKFWEQLLPLAEEIDATFVIENCWEPTPDNIAALLDKAQSPRLKACLDVGHANVWSCVSLPQWVSSLGDHLVHVHLHDNHGDYDDHLAIGDGGIDFDPFFKAIVDRVNAGAPRPWFTLEVPGFAETAPSLHRLGWSTLW